MEENDYRMYEKIIAETENGSKKESITKIYLHNGERLWDTQSLIGLKANQISREKK